MTKPIGLCEAPVQEKIEALEKVLDIGLPDCATVTIGKEKEILAVATDGLGTSRVVKINPKGEVFVSTYCSERARITTYVYQYTTPDGPAEPVAVVSCRDINHVKQSGSVSPDKLAKAKALILGTDKPKVK